MSDPVLKLPDPQHHANPQYNGIDWLALGYVRQREAAMEQVNAQMAAMTEASKTDGTVLKESEVKADIGGSNEKYAGGALKREILNSYFNHPLIHADFASGRAKNLEPGQGKGPALIIGSGPTLDDAHDLIRGWKGGLFCSSSQAITMLALGKRAFDIVAVDVKTESDEFMPLDVWEDKDCNLILHPGMDPEVIQTWRWKKTFFRIMVHGMQFYLESMPIAYSMIRTTMYVYGCVAATQILVASMMGYGPLFLVGCDFGYPEDKSRFTGFKRVGSEWVREDQSPAPKYRLHPKVIYRNGCPSDHFQAYYKQTFFNVWRLSLNDIFTVSRKGGLYEVPHVDAAEVAATEGRLRPERFWLSQRDKIDLCERYLLQYGTYTFTFPSGQVEFVLFRDEETELPKYIEMMNEVFAKQGQAGRLILGEERGRLAYLRNDAAWEAKEKRWQWEIMSPQSPTATASEPSSTSG